MVQCVFQDSLFPPTAVMVREWFGSSEQDRNKGTAQVTLVTLHVYLAYLLTKLLTYLLIY